MDDWGSGWREWYEAHQDSADDIVFGKFAECREKFDYSKFVEHYNNLSDSEWQEVIKAAAKLGYDIRSVLHYKKERGDGFDVEFLYEIISPLLCMDGASAFGYEDEIVYDYPEPMREEISERYARWGLPIPEYWKLRLWFEP